MPKKLEVAGNVQGRKKGCWGDSKCDGVDV